MGFYCLTCKKLVSDSDNNVSQCVHWTTKYVTPLIDNNYYSIKCNLCGKLHTNKHNYFDKLTCCTHTIVYMHPNITPSEQRKLMGLKPLTINCGVCIGRGTITYVDSFMTCENCEGNGGIKCMHCKGIGTLVSFRASEICNGTGTLPKIKRIEMCQECVQS